MVVDSFDFYLSFQLSMFSKVNKYKEDMTEQDFDDE
jgi:hypothetical protein